MLRFKSIHVGWSLWVYLFTFPGIISELNVSTYLSKIYSLETCDIVPHFLLLSWLGRKVWTHIDLGNQICLKDIINTLRPRWNGRHFADDIFKCIFLNEDVKVLIKISLKFVPKGPINNIIKCFSYEKVRQPCLYFRGNEGAFMISASWSD